MQQRGTYDFDFDRFDKLPRFQLDEITAEQFLELAMRIRLVHSLGYEWDATAVVSDSDLEHLIAELLSVPSPDRIRSAIQGVVEALDSALEDD